MCDIPTLGGPFRTAGDYYRAWSMWKEQDPRRTTRPNPDFPKRIAAVADDISMQNTGPFALFHVDFGDHNILVDDDYNVVGVIDWAGAYVLPLEFAAIYPDLLYTLPEVFWRGSPLEMVAEEMSKSQRVLQRRYLEYVCQVEQKRGYKQKLSVLLGSYSSTVALCVRLYCDGNRNCLEALLDERFPDHARYQSRSLE